MEINFSRTVGQAFARSFFTQAVRNQAFPHAILVHGMPGLGQSALLLDLADILLCESADVKPCHSCPGCLERKHRKSDRLTYLFPLEKKAQESEDIRVADMLAKIEILEKNPYALFKFEKEFLSIAQIRELQTRLGFADPATRRRVVLIFGAEYMPLPSANAFLKLLEEPPPNVHFLLSTESRSSLMPTILSRCIQAGLTPLDTSEMEAGAKAARQWSDAGFIPEFLALSEGSLGNYLELSLQSGEGDLQEAGRFVSASVSPDWEVFSAYLEETSAFGDMENCARLLRLVLALIRYHHARDGERPETSLQDTLASLGELPDLRRYALFVERTLAAVKGYSKPSIAAMTNYLEYEMEVHTPS